VPLFVQHEFSHEQNNQFSLKFYMKNDVLPVYRMMLGILTFLDESPTSEAIKPGAVLGFCEALTSAFNIGAVCF
jgi:hypothetical protein